MQRISILMPRSLFQAAYQLHHAQRITAEGEEAVIGTEGDARQDFPENGADNRLDLLRGSIGWELDFLPGDSGCALLGICGITAASATVKEGQPAAFVQGMGRQCFDLRLSVRGRLPAGVKATSQKEKPKFRAVRRLTWAAMAA